MGARPILGLSNILHRSYFEPSALPEMRDLGLIIEALHTGFLGRADILQNIISKKVIEASWVPLLSDVPKAKGLKE